MGKKCLIMIKYLGGVPFFHSMVLKFILSPFRWGKTKVIFTKVQFWDTPNICFWSRLTVATSISFVKVLPDFDGTYLTVFDRLWTIYSGHETDR